MIGAVRTMFSEHLKKLSNQSLTLLQIARAHARASGHPTLETEHLAAAFLFVTTDLTALLEATGMSSDKHSAIPTEHLLEVPLDDDWQCSDAIEQIVSAAITITKLMYHRLADPLHLMFGFLEWSDPQGRCVLDAAGIDLQALKRRLKLQLKIRPQDFVPQSENAEPTTPSKSKLPITPTKLAISDWFSDDCKHLLSVAYGRARERQRRNVALDDLFVGLLRSKDTTACQAIAQHANLERLELATESLERQALSSDSSMFSTAAMHLLKGAHKRALGGMIKPEHLLLSLLDQHTHEPLAIEFSLPMEDAVIQRVRESLYDKLGYKPAESSAGNPPLSGADLEALHESTGTSSTILVTKRLRRVLTIAKSEASDIGHAKVEPEHLAIGCIIEAQISETTFVENREFDFQMMRADLEDEARDRWKTAENILELHDITFSDEAVQYVSKASREAERVGSKIADLNHLVIALLCGNDGRFADLLEANSVKPSLLRRRLDYCWSRQASQVIEGVTLNLLDMTQPSAEEPAERVSLPRQERPTRPSNVFSRLSARTKNLLKFAGNETWHTDRDFVGLEELFLGILAQPGLAADLITEYGITLEETRERFHQVHARGPGRLHGKKLSHTQSVQLIFGQAHELAREKKKRLIEPELILLAMLRECHGVATVLFEALNIDGVELAEILEARLEA